MSAYSHNPADAAFESILKDAHCKIKGMLGSIYMIFHFYIKMIFSALKIIIL